jgi:hypothetical protein
MYKNLDEKSLPILQKNHWKYEDTVNYLTIQSKSRNLNEYPQPSNYKIIFEQKYKNVKSIELISATLPDQGNITDEPYLLLNINEITNIDSSIDEIYNSFAILQIPQIITSGKFINIPSGLSCEGTPRVFKTPISLDRITISIRNYNNELFDFGDDTLGIPPNKQYQNIFIFKIITREKKRECSKFSNVY